MRGFQPNPHLLVGAMRRAVEEAPEYVTPTTRRARLREELEVRAILPVAFGKVARRKRLAFFRVLGFGVSVHDSKRCDPLAKLLDGRPYRQLGRFHVRWLTPYLDRLDEAAAFVLRGEL